MRVGAPTQVERYVFFPACAERFGTARPALLDQARDEDPDHGMLAAVLRVLLEVMHALLLLLAACSKLTSFWHAMFVARTWACCHGRWLIAGARLRKGTGYKCAPNVISSLSSIISGCRVWCRCAGMLTWACAQVHATVFAAAEGEPARDARVALAAVRRRVLAGTRICFSAVIPRGAAAPRAHALWRLAEEVRSARPGSPSLEWLFSHRY